MIVAIQWPMVLLSNNQVIDYAFDFVWIQGQTIALYNVIKSIQSNGYNEMIMHLCMLHPNYEMEIQRNKRNDFFFKKKVQKRKVQFSQKNVNDWITQLT